MPREASNTPSVLLAAVASIAALVSVYGVAIYTAWLIGDQPRYGYWDGALLVTYFVLWAVACGLIALSGYLTVGWWRARSI